MFESTFPHFNLKTSNRIGFIFPKLKEVQYIRNRISHHEVIFDYPASVNNCYNNILLLLSWLSPEIRSLADEVSSFNEVWKENTRIFLKSTSDFSKVNNIFLNTD